MADIDGGNGFFSMEMPDIQGLIKQLDLMNKYANQEVRDGLHEGAEIICKEQKRLADATGVSFLAPAITVGHIKIKNPYTQITQTNSQNLLLHNPATKRTYYGVLSITIGYHANAFNYEQTKNHDSRTYTTSRNGTVHDGDYWKAASRDKPGIIGMVYEFGRPGKSSAHHRNSKTMKQIRMRIPNKKDTKRKYWKKAVPTEVDWNKGTIQPRPHIRRGFDNKVNAAVQALLNHVNNAINRAGDN